MHGRLCVSFYFSTAEVPRLLLEEPKIELNAKNSDGDTPLHMACRSNRFETVQLLVQDQRCNPLEKNSRGDTALHEACSLDVSGNNTRVLMRSLRIYYVNCTSCIKKHYTGESIFELRITSVCSMF